MSMMMMKTILRGRKNTTGRCINMSLDKPPRMLECRHSMMMSFLVIFDHKPCAGRPCRAEGAPRSQLTEEDSPKDIGLCKHFRSDCTK